MFSWPPFVRRSLPRLPIIGQDTENLRVEQVLAIFRLILSLTCLAAWLFFPVRSALQYQVGLALLIGYNACGIVFLAWLALRRKVGDPFVLCAKVNDLAWPSLLCMVADAPYWPFYVLFIFAIIAAAFRSGFFETLAAAVLGVIVLLLHAALSWHGPEVFRASFRGSDEPALLAIRCVFLLAGGILLGVLGEGEKGLRAEIALTNRLLSLARGGDRFSSVLRDVLTELGRIFQGTAVYEVVAQSSTGRAYRWEVPSLVRPSIHNTELNSAEKTSSLMSAYPSAFYMERNGTVHTCSMTAIDEEGRRLAAAQTVELKMPLPEAESVLVVGHDMGRDWSGRFVLVNPRLGRRPEPQLRFVQEVMRQIGPALYSVYLLWGFRRRAGATERARVARELHDTTIQSLIGIEMQVDVLRRRSNDGHLASELERIQELLRQEVLNLRELMQAMRPVDVSPHQFLDFIADLVERFSRDTGISVRFISELQEVTLPAGTCRELVRIVQEGLVNIRKHSGAQSAVVHFGSQDGLWKLVINDDGKGFPFAGRLTLTELDAIRRGPAVIKERVRAIGGDMMMESTPGHGSRLEITIPQKGYESYG